MPTRYQPNKNIKIRYDGKPFFGTRYYPIIPQRDDDVLYITNDTDYLDSLAFKFYGDKSLWWIIAISNGLGNGRLSVQSGIQLRIPTQIDAVISNYNMVNI